MFAKVEKMLFRAEDAAGVLLILVMATAVLMQVVSRFVIKAPLSYTEELSRFMLIWLTFIGAAMALREDGHFAVDVFSHRLPERARYLAKLAIYTIMQAYLVFLFVTSLSLMTVAGMQTSAALNLNMSYVYLAIPVGTGLMVLHLLIMQIDCVLRFFGRTALSSHGAQPSH